MLPRRDTLDQRIVNDVKFRLGRMIDVQGGYPHGTAYASTVNAWPTLNAGTAPVDTDHDGMPDTWETANGLNPNDASDRGLIAANGYTNLENYLNSISAAPITVAATNPASATWTLLANQSPTTIGSITANDQTLGSYFTGIQYGSTFGTVANWQRVATTSFLPVGYDANAYVEYKLTPAAGKKFTATSIELGALGGGTGTAKILMYYSLNGFATSTPVGATTYNGITYAATDTSAAVALLNTSTATLTGQQVANAPTVIDVLPSQTLSVRVYVWITGTGSRYFPSQNMKVDGITTDLAVPVTLISFSAAANDEVKLSWKTSNETNMKNYEVERSNDGQNFATLGMVAASNSSTTSNYSFADNTKENAKVYYRLRMNEKDGSFRYSYIIIVNGKGRSGISIYPNPATSLVTLSHMAVGTNAFATILNMEGKRLQSISIARGSTQTSFAINQLDAGVYSIQFINDNGIQNIKFFKQ